MVCGFALAQSAASSPQQNSTPAPSTPAPATQPKLQLQDLPPDPHTPTAAEVDQQHQQQVLQAALRLASAQAHWGPELNAPGVSIALTEVKRAQTSEGTTQVTYRITATGFAPDDKLMLVRWPLNAEARTVLGGIEVDAKGFAVCGSVSANALADARAALSGGSSNPAGPAQGQAPTGPGAAPPPKGRAAIPANPPPDCGTTMEPQQPVELVTTTAPGEAVRVALLTTYRKRGAAASTIPFPLANTDKGCRLQVILGMKDAALVLVEGTGFPPNTPLTFNAVTGDSTRPLHPTANADGRIMMPLLAGAKGQPSGETTVRFAGINRPPTLDTQKQPTPDPDCSPSVTYHWGDGSYKAE